MPLRPNQISQLNLVRNSFAKVWADEDCEAKLADLAKEDFPLFLKCVMGLMPKIREIEIATNQQAALPGGDLTNQMMALGTQMMREMRASGAITGLVIPPEQMLKALPELNKPDDGRTVEGGAEGADGEGGPSPDGGDPSLPV